MARRHLVSLCTSVAAVATTLALLPALSAHADPSVTMTIAPTHGVPGATVTATISTDECEPSAVTVTGTYVNTDGDDATTPTVTATSVDGGYTATLTVPADAARTSLSEEPVTFTASADCTPAQDPTPTDTPTETPTTQPPALKAQAVAAAAPLTTGKATVVVDDLKAAVLTVDPGSVVLGKSFDYSITGCVGGVADFYLEDNAGTDTDIPDSSVTSHPTSTGYKGTFTVPADDVTGDAGVFLECAQAASADAALLLTDALGNGTGAGNPVAVPVTSTPHFTG